MQMVRVLLHDQGVQYEEVYADNWPELKKEGIADGSLPFGQLPKYEEEGLVLVQSQSIMRHLARKYKLYGKDDKEAAMTDMIADEVADFRRTYGTLVYGDSCAPEKVEAFKAALMDRFGRGGYLGHIEAFLAKNGGPFLIGESLTFADYCLFELLGTITRLIPDLLSANPVPHLAKWYTAFGERPALKAYVQSEAEHRVKANGNGLA